MTGTAGRGVTRAVPHAHLLTPNADEKSLVKSAGSDQEGKGTGRGCAVGLTDCLTVEV